MNYIERKAKILLDGIHSFQEHILLLIVNMKMMNQLLQVFILMPQVKEVILEVMFGKMSIMMEKLMKVLMKILMVLEENF